MLAALVQMGTCLNVFMVLCLGAGVRKWISEEV